MVFATIAEAQKRELIDLIAGDKVATDNEIKAAEFMVAHTDEIVAILTCTPKSKARASRAATRARHERRRQQPRRWYECHHLRQAASVQMRP